MTMYNFFGRYIEKINQNKKSTILAIFFSLSILVAILAFGFNGKQVSGAEIGDLRYLRVEITKKDSWVSLREIETYDQDGNLITPVSATANQYLYPPSAPVPQLPSRVYDRDPVTVWNAGETNQSCVHPYNPECIRSAWIQLDYGSLKKVSAFRVLDENWVPEEVIVLKGSKDGVNYTNITQFTNTDLSFTKYTAFAQWLEYPAPAPQYAGDPTATVTANGKKNLAISPEEGVTIKWQATNADEVSFSSTMRMRTLESAGINCEPIDFPVLRTFTFFAGGPNSRYDPKTDYIINGLRGNTLNGERGFGISDCDKGKTVSIKYTVRQKGTGKTASDTVTLNVDNNFLTTDPMSSVYYRMFPYATPGPQTPPGLSLNSNLQIFKEVLLTSRQATDYVDILDRLEAGIPLPPLDNPPTLSFDPLPAGITATVGSTVPYSGGHPLYIGSKVANISIQVNPSITPGGYFIRLVADRGLSTEQAMEIPVWVLRDGETSFSYDRFNKPETSVWQGTPPPPDRLEIIPFYTNAFVGNLKKFQAWFFPAGRATLGQKQTTNATWSSSPTSVLSPTPNKGEFSAVAVGTGTVTGTLNGKSGIAEVNVIPGSGGGGGEGDFTVDMTATPTGPLIAPGATTLTWTTSQDADSCDAAGTDWSGTNIESGTGVALRSGMGARTYVFKIVCHKAGETDAEDTVTVVVNEGSVVVDRLTVDMIATPPGPLVSPGATTLTWTTSQDADSCDAAGTDWSGSNLTSGEGAAVRSGMPVGTYNFRIICHKAGQPDATDAVTIAVVPEIIGVGCVNPSPMPANYMTPCPALELSGYALSSGRSLTVKVGPENEENEFFIFKTIYISESRNSCPGGGNKINGSWCALNLSGLLLGGETDYLKNGNYELSPYAVSQLSSGKHYVISWDWRWNGNCFVGPGSELCNSGKWRLQSFIK